MNFPAFFAHIYQRCRILAITVFAHTNTQNVKKKFCLSLHFLNNSYLLFLTFQLLCISVSQLFILSLKLFLILAIQLVSIFLYIFCYRKKDRILILRFSQNTLIYISVFMICSYLLENLG